MKKLAIIILFILLTCGCSKISQDEISSKNNSEGYEEINNGDSEVNNTAIFDKKTIMDDEYAYSIITNESFRKAVAAKKSCETAEDFFANLVGEYEYHEEYLFPSEKDKNMQEQKRVSGKLIITDSSISAEYVIEDYSDNKITQVNANVIDTIWIEDDYAFLMTDAHEKTGEAEHYNLYILHVVEDTIEMYRAVSEPITPDVFTGDGAFSNCIYIFKAEKNADSNNSSMANIRNRMDPVVPTSETIAAAREYCREHLGGHDDLFIELHMIEFGEAYEKPGDYMIAGNGFYPIYSDQCVQVENGNDGSTTYYFYIPANEYMDAYYIKLVHDSNNDTFYSSPYGSDGSMESCTEICGQF